VQIILFYWYSDGKRGRRSDDVFPFFTRYMIFVPLCITKVHKRITKWAQSSVQYKRGYFVSTVPDTSTCRPEKESNKLDNNHRNIRAPMGHTRKSGCPVCRPLKKKTGKQS